MKKISLILLSMLFISSVFAQKEYLPTLEDLDHFLKTKTYVVLDESPMSDFNFEIKDLMESFWNITGYEYIKSTEFPEKSRDENASFIYTSLVSFERDKTDSRYVFLHLSLGGPNLTMDDLRDIVSVPMGYFGVDSDHYMYKLGILLRFMQNHVKLIQENPDLISNNIFKHYNDNIAKIHDKTLYLVEDELSKEISTAARIKNVYPYKFKLVTRDDIHNAILEGDENVVFLHKVGPEGKKLKARVYNIIIGAADANFYYFDYHMVSDKNPDGLLESDLKKLAK